MIVVENNESYSILVGRILRFLNMTTKDVASFLKYLPEYCSYDEDEILEGLNWNEQQIAEMRQIMKEEQDKIAKKMKELSKLIIQRRMSISNIGSPISGSPIASPIGRSSSFSTPSNSNSNNYHHY
jgi:23S rRNA pseudoU1915 N3-methylase RlmH